MPEGGRRRLIDCACLEQQLRASFDYVRGPFIGPAISTGCRLTDTIAAVWVRTRLETTVLFLIFTSIQHVLHDHSIFITKASV